MIYIDREINARQLDAHQVIWNHDECQFQCKKEHAEELMKICVDTMKEVEYYYDFKCPLEAEAKIGNNWSETH